MVEEGTEQWLLVGDRRVVRSIDDATLSAGKRVLETFGEDRSALRVWRTRCRRWIEHCPRLEGGLYDCLASHYERHLMEAIRIRHPAKHWANRVTCTLCGQVLRGQAPFTLEDLIGLLHGHCDRVDALFGVFRPTLPIAEVPKPAMVGLCFGLALLRPDLYAKAIARSYTSVDTILEDIERSPEGSRLAPWLLEHGVMIQTRLLHSIQVTLLRAIQHATQPEGVPPVEVES